MRNSDRETPELRDINPQSEIRDPQFSMIHALRSLAKSPGFTSVALITLALGIGVNTTSFSVLNVLLLQPPPYPDPDALVRVYGTSPRGQTGSHSPANFLDYRAQNTVFDHMAAIRFADFNLGESGQPADRLRGMVVTADFFPLLRMVPQRGRTFTPEEDRPDNGVVVISHDTWRQRFGGDPAVVGRSVRIDGEPVTIIGVMPAAFDARLLWGEVQAWRPMALPDLANADRENTYLRVIARLKSASPESLQQPRGPEPVERRRRSTVPLDQAQSAMNALSAQLALAYPATNTERGIRLVSLAASTQDDASRRIAWLVAGLAGFVLLIACANLANLQFARNAARARDHAIRAALGASRAQLVRLVLTESVVLSLIGGALGVVFALWTNDLAGRSFASGDRIGLDIPLDLRVLAFTFIVSVLTGIGFGFLPAWLGAPANVNDSLKQGSRGTTAGRSQNRIRHALIVAEVALALVLLTGAGLFVRGLGRVLERDAGWRTDNLITASLSLRGRDYDNTAARGAFYRRLHERLTALPGVDHVALATSVPTSGYDTNSSFVVEGQPPPAASRSPVADVAAVTPGYFATLGIRLLQGRDFTANDHAAAPRVVVINETMARTFWPGESPIGKRIGGATPFMENPREIIGVVRDVRPAATLDDRAGRFQFYRSLAQWSFNSATIVLRSRHAPESVAHDLRRSLAGLDPDQAVYRINTVRHEIDQGLGRIDSAAHALVGFAVLGLLLAAVGIYGVIANSVVQRTNEIGVRMALGAQVGDILRLVLGSGLRLTLIGSLLGLTGAWCIGRFLPSISPEFPATAPSLTVGITGILIIVAMLACYLPARRATKVNPISALRAE